MRSVGDRAYNFLLSAEAWPNLPKAVKAGMAAMAEALLRGGG